MADAVLGIDARSYCRLARPLRCHGRRQVARPGPLGRCWRSMVIAGVAGDAVPLLPGADQRHQIVGRLRRERPAGRCRASIDFSAIVKFWGLADFTPQAVVNSAIISGSQSPSSAPCSACSTPMPSASARSGAPAIILIVLLAPGPHGAAGIDRLSALLHGQGDRALRHADFGHHHILGAAERVRDFTCLSSVLGSFPREIIAKPTPKSTARPSAGKFSWLRA